MTVNFVQLLRFDTPTEEKDANSVFKIASKEKPFYKYQFKSRDEIPNKAGIYGPSVHTNQVFQFFDCQRIHVTRLNDYKDGIITHLNVV